MTHPYIAPSEALRKLALAACAIDSALTDLIGTDAYPDALTDAHTELRLASWEAERALAYAQLASPSDPPSTV